MKKLVILWYDVLKGIGECKDDFDNVVFINSNLTRLGSDKAAFFKLKPNLIIEGYVIELRKGELVLDFLELN